MASLSSDPDKVKRWVVIKNWLVALDLILPSPDAPEDALEVLGLIEDLKNGQILCRLANRIKPGSVDSIQNESHTPSAAEYNMDKFTQACVDLELFPDQIFKPDDLLMGDDFTAVLVTLEALYSHASALGMGRQFTKHSLRRKSSKKMNKPEIPEDWKRPSSLVHESIQEHVVKALFPFKGAEEDELSFEAGERIIVKNVLDGKWWEGECNGRVGWFPGNYVTELTSSGTASKQPESGGANKESSLQIFYNLDIQDLLDALRTYRDDLYHLQSQFLEPLAISSTLPGHLLSTLELNVKQLVAFETKQFEKLEEICSRPPENQNVGEFILENIPQIELLYFQFFACHPKALSVITENSDVISAFIEKQGGPSPGMITLSLYLGKPMKMLDKYVTQLMELERHIPETHKDLANMKEAASKFKLLYASVQEVRKRKEVELEMVTSKIDNWGGKNLEELGECYFSTQVYLNMDFQQTNFVLIFGGAMAILEVEQSLSGYRLRELYELNAVSLSPLQDNTFYPIEIRDQRSCEMIYCDRVTDRDGILQSVDLCKVMPMNKPTFNAPPPPPPSTDNSMNNSEEGKKYPLQRSRSDIPRGLVSLNNNTQSGMFQSQLSSRQIQLSQPGAAQPKINRPLYWGFKSLRPLPPAKPPKMEQEQKFFMKRGSISGYKKKRTRPASSESTGFTEAEKQRAENESSNLRVVESYNTTRPKLIPRQTMLIRYNSLENPIDEASQPILHSIETQMNKLTAEISKLRAELEFESNERKKLEALLNSLQSKRSPL